jgi:DNA-binding LytR/AlgR family response regulator
VLSKKLLRNSLKAVTESLVEHPQLFRCHKSYLVNLLNVVHVSGNAQGYKLHLLNTDFRVPVSRQHNEEIKKRLAGTP